MRRLSGGGSQREPTEERGLAFFVGRHSQALHGVVDSATVVSLRVATAWGWDQGLDDSEPLKPSAPLLMRPYIYGKQCQANEKN